jgi:dTDP-4-amino-4,6-dideoxygalactose transaminase
VKKNKPGEMIFDKEFTRQEPIPQEGIERALDVLRSGRLHRYNAPAGVRSETSLLEVEFAQYLGRKYCLACTSCGSALHLALLSAGVRRDDKVLCNAYTLAPVPGAIENTGARTVLVEIGEDYTLDLADLERKAGQTGAKYLLLSHMRGHMADMDQIGQICSRHALILIEDCAHTMGAFWDGKPSGTFGEYGCFSTQTYKHLNSGEGGMLVTDDDLGMARAILYSGSYMLYEKHAARPPLETFEDLIRMTPNYSLRMDDLRAALLRPQLRELPRRAERWNERYSLLEAMLNRIGPIRVPERNPKESYVGSSIQFTLQGLTREQVVEFLDGCARRGVDIKWFGSSRPRGYTSSFESWEYLGDLPDLPATRDILDNMCDFRIPLTFSMEDCRKIVLIVENVLAAI